MRERKTINDVLRQGVQGISELITEHGLGNLKFKNRLIFLSVYFLNSPFDKKTIEQEAENDHG